MEDLNRRQFLKAAGISATAAGALGLFGCSTGSTATEAAAGIPETWDEEADFVVLGSGTALTGALKAAVGGMSVIVLEKGKQIGGTTALSGGQVWVPCNDFSAEKDDATLAKTYMTKVAAGLSTEAIIDTYIARASEMVNFIAEQTGCEWSVSPRIDYHAQWEGASRDMRSLSCVINGKRSGAHFTQPEAEVITSLGGKIMTETVGKRLVSRITEDGGQEVLGVIAETGGKEIAIKANKGVLVGTGGFSYNEDMLKAYHPIPMKACMCVPESTGDGIRMAQAVGANLTMMPWGWGQVQFKVLSDEYYANKACSTAVSLYAYQTKPGSVFINHQGKRFCDEASDYDSLWFGFQGQFTTGDMELINVPAWYVCDHSVREALADPAKGDVFFGVGLDSDLPEWGYTADTIEELATKIGVDPAALKNQIDKYNQDAANGMDTDFHRGESAFENYNMMNSGPTLGGLTKAPFYAAEIVPAYQGTKGGIQINEFGQALSASSNPIPRLYACGNTTGCGTPGKYYTGAGGTNGPGMVFAYLAAEHASQLEIWA
ncbi:MAG: FAD-binding protein [Actinobacteria bacterium]|nr:FAD-binding protein [Actinomycetota bacterium]